MKNERPFSGIWGPYRVLHLIAIISAIFATVEAQSAGSISGRVITGDGKGVPQVDVWIYPAGSGARRVAPGSTSIVATDEEGRFRFTDLSPSPYRIDVREAREYAVQSTSGIEGRRPRYFYAGDQVTITLVKGGAITGRVTTPEGEPMVRAQVSPIMVRDAEGNPVRQSIPTGWSLADDRGIYRLFGLAPGTYLVFTNGCSFYSPMPHTQQLQIYHPSSTRETATEVTVTSGGEVSGADIRFRHDFGRVVSGTITGDDAPPSSSATGGVVSTTGNTFLTNTATGVSLSGWTYRTG
ncbi:MAG TPA: carboxypeptidase-like regulatory domain-containing protein, partial [Blastocatellia bacterium]|nr:carboxypeptidase-like regulatory domain-containing protein [Blastocatellia bacterium]